MYYWIKRCPVDAKACDDIYLQREAWGNTSDEAIVSFKKHLRNKHSIVDPEIVEDICERCEIASCIESAPVDTICADLKWSSYQSPGRISSPTGRGDE